MVEDLSPRQKASAFVAAVESIAPNHGCNIESEPVEARGVDNTALATILIKAASAQLVTYIIPDVDSLALAFNGTPWGVTKNPSSSSITFEHARFYIFK